MAEPYDEGAAADHTAVLAAVRAAGPEALAARVRARAAEEGVAYGPGTLWVDPVPRVFARAEWDALAAGLAQRLRAVNRFLADAYGARQAVADGVVPERVITGSAFFEPEVRGLLDGWERPPAWCGVAGPDVVRDRDGALLLLEDNVRLPSGLGYAIAAREAVGPVLGALPGVPEPADVAGPGLAAFARALRAAAPPDVAEPAAAVLTDPRGNDARYEQEALARRLGLPVVVFDDLEPAPGGGVARRDERGRRHRVDVLYRRSNVDTVRDAYGNRTALHALLAPIRAGRLGMVNLPGSGVADDKALMAFMPALVRFFCGEEPLLAQPDTRDLADAAARAAVLDDPAAWVFKPGDASGGEGIVVGPVAETGEVDAAVAAVRDEPGGWVAQAPLELSVHPTVVDGRLAPRRVDLRPVVLAAGDEVTVAPGGMSRFASAPGDPLVNLSAGGGLKDVWVV